MKEYSLSITLGINTHPLPKPHWRYHSAFGHTWGYLSWLWFFCEVACERSLPMYDRDDVDDWEDDDEEWGIQDRR